MPISLPPISRRSFLKGTAAIAGGLLACRVAGADAAVPVDPNRLALFSDTHVAADRAAMHATKVRMWDRFVQARDEVLALSPRPAALLINGDCALLEGRAADYRTFADGLAPVRAAGIPVHLGLGNHDNRENLREVCGADDCAIGELDHRVLRIDFPHLDWYVLDSLVKPNSTPGLLGAEQLAWLARSLDGRADRPAVVMVHHQPDHSAPEKASGLTDTRAFLEIVQPRKQVKAVLFGHTHAWRHSEEEGLHLVNLPATAYVFDPQQPAGWVDAAMSPRGMKLKLKALIQKHPKDGEVLELSWR